MSDAITITPVSDAPIQVGAAAGLPVVITPVAPEAIALIGVVGIPGPPGPPGAAIVFTQAAPAALWTIAHNLGRFPVVTLYTAGGVLFLATVINLSPNVCQVLMDEPTAGKAILS